jgi:hypothetical protein
MAGSRGVRWLVPLALLASTGCTTPYANPDPKTTATTRIVVRSPLAGNPMGGHATLHVHGESGACDRALGRLGSSYQGSLDMDLREQEIQVPAARPVFFRFSYFENAPDAPLGCSFWIGFVPREHETYVLDLSIRGWRSCHADVLASWGRVALRPPGSCLAGD